MASPRRITEAQMRLVKPGLKLFTAFHVFLYKFTGGRLFNRIGGGEICIVKMTGAKSGQTREFPLMYVPYRNGIVLVASLAGAPSHPVWYHNLVKYPQFEVTVGSVVKKSSSPELRAKKKRRRYGLYAVRPTPISSYTKTERNAISQYSSASQVMPNIERRSSDQTPNQPMERTPPCCALRRRSSAR